jgi:hypothetical protein
VSLSHLDRPITGERFRHEALLYAGEDEFLDRSAAFVRAGVVAGEPVLVVVSARKIDRLREALGVDANTVIFADMAAVGRNPARIIPAWHDFVARHAAPGGRLRGIGEPIFPGRTPDEVVECQRHESLLNLAFADTKGFSLLCPYDVETLPAALIDEVGRSHRVVSRGEGHVHAAAYEGADTMAAPFTSPLPAPPAGAAELRFGTSGLDAVRAFVAEQAARAGLAMSRRIHLIVAASEVAGESLEQGDRPDTLRFWSQAGRVVCEIRDHLRLEDPLADRQLPDDESDEAGGLLIANQLCDLVQVRSLPAGRVVRLQMTRA